MTELPGTVLRCPALTRYSRMIMLFIFPVTLLAACFCGLVDALRFGSVLKIRSVIFIVLFGQIFAYVLALWMLSLDPYFDDNGTLTRIEDHQLWFWALEIGGWLAVVLVPVLLVIRFLLQIALRAIR